MNIKCEISIILEQSWLLLHLNFSHLDFEKINIYLT